MLKGGVGPTRPGERIAVVDALRGMALFGVLAINLETVFRVSIFEQFLPHRPERGLDQLVDALLTIFLDMKAFAVFSLLFGVGLAIQYERLGPGPRRRVLLVRRLLALLAFGLIHLFLIWNGDILTEYALGGLLIRPFLFAPTWAVAVGACAALLLYLAMPLAPPLLPFPGQEWLRAHVDAANLAYGEGGFGRVLAFRITEMPGILVLLVEVFPRTIGLFLVGVLAWRLDVVRSARSRWLWIAAGLSIAAGLLLTLATTGRPYSGWPYLGPAAAIARPAAPVFLALGYSAGVIAAGTLPPIRPLLAIVEPLGRMAFTNYIVQSIIMGWIFYGYGLGLFDRTGLAAGFALVVVIYFAQAPISAWWLKRFRYGPLEWLWRAAMYGELPPFRLRPGVDAAQRGVADVG